MEIDLHGYELWEAIEEILLRLEECQLNGIRELLIIHGYQHGQRLKNYVQSNGFLAEMEKEGFKLKRKESANPGETPFLLL